MTIPFGKHKFKPLEDIPDDYLAWCLDNIKDLSPTLRRAIEQRLGIEANDGGGGISVVATILPAWYRRLASEFHPDRRGGSHVGMLAVNRANELLLEMMEAAA